MVSEESRDSPPSETNQQLLIRTNQHPHPPTNQQFPNPTNQQLQPSSKNEPARRNSRPGFEEIVTEPPVTSKTVLSTQALIDASCAGRRTLTQVPSLTPQRRCVPCPPRPPPHSTPRGRTRSWPRAHNRGWTSTHPRAVVYTLASNTRR